MMQRGACDKSTSAYSVTAKRFSEMPKARKLEPLEPNGQIDSDGLTTGIVVPVVGGQAGTR